MSSVAEGVSKHISRECEVNPNRKAFFLEMHKMLGLLLARTGNSGFRFGRQSPARCLGSPGGWVGTERHLPAAGARHASHPFVKRALRTRCSKDTIQREMRKCIPFTSLPHFLLQISLGRRRKEKRNRNVPLKKQGVRASLVAQWLSLPANAGDAGSSPGLGRSHMPQSN